MGVAAPPDLRCASLVVAGEALQVLSYALDEAPVSARAVADPPLLARLTKAQREVARLVLAGLDNEAVAIERGTSPRTVAKQLESIYRTFGVGSRLELVAHLERDRSAADAGGDDRA